MKKIFQLKQENKHPDRVIDSIKNEIRKYLKRERKKKLPGDAIFWDFDCRFGQNKEESQILPASALVNALDSAKEKDWAECYVEIFAKASYKKEEITDKEDL